MLREKNNNLNFNLLNMSETDYQDLVISIAQSQFRQTYHIQPKTGLLNDPNGLIYDGLLYHIFHQWHPKDAVHGLKYWYHYTSKDLVHFKDEGVALAPDTQYDSHGVYSGSAFLKDNVLHLMYTGNHRDKDNKRIPYQIIATQTSDETFKKLNKPVIKGYPQGYTEHFRDPKVWKHKDTYYSIIGAQRENNTGTALVYQANDIEKWELKGEIKTKLNEFGYMWECPDLFNLDNHDVFIFSPQGIEQNGEKYQNIYQSGYLIGEFDYNNLEFTHGDFYELDNGFDFYAPQTFLDENGKRILIGWMGLPELKYPTDNEKWAHCLTIPRTLEIIDGKLIQKPIKALESLRSNEETALGYANKHTVKLHPYEGKHYELIIDILENEATEIYFEVRVSKKYATQIIYNTRTKKVTLDRLESGQLSDNENDFRRSTTLDNELKQIRIYSDTSSLEIFLNNGERVMTTRIFPDENAINFRTSTESGQVYLKFTKYDIKL